MKEYDTNTPDRARLIDNQENELFRAYHWYRILLAALLYLLTYSSDQISVFGNLHPTLFWYVNLLYLSITIISLIFSRFRSRTPSHLSVFISLLFDIGAMSLLLYASGGVGSGLEVITIVPVAVASIFFAGNTATLVAACAAICLLVVNSLLAINSEKYLHQYTSAGLTGTLFFITSFSIQYLARRIRNTQAYAAQKSEDAANLQELNEMIVQRLRTGIIVCDSHGEITLHNQSAAELLFGNQENLNDDINDYKNFKQIPSALQIQLEQWQSAPNKYIAPHDFVQQDQGVQVSFASLTHRPQHNETLIFLEDTGRLAQQAQQLKLASLGRLTASIAHEIRNPLSAISHAAQLLQESDNLDAADTKLSHIIHNHCRRVNGIIENVLALSRRKNAKPEAIELSQWLNDFKKSLAESYENSLNIDIEVNPENLSANFDPSQLTQVLNNLCQNGLRYSYQNTGQYSLQLHAGIQKNTQRPYLDIIDFGKGIDSSLKDKIFEPFFTTENTGTGLGLYLAKELCEANQAKLSCTGEYQGKNAFSIIFAHSAKNINQGYLE